MPASAEQIAANRRNSTRSTGPTSASGKENSKRNGLKHGLTGEGIILMREDEAEVASLREELEGELRPQTKLGRVLVGRVATMTVRLEKCAKRESAKTAVRVRQSAFHFEDGRIAEVDGLFARLMADPVGVVRKLRRTPEGVDRLIESVTQIRDRLIHPDRGSWNNSDRDWVDRFSSRLPGVPGSRIGRLTRALGGDFSALESHEGPGLDQPARKAWAVGQMIELINDDLAALRAHRESFGANFTAMERAEAADIALFDDSNEATRLQKYEATAERLLYRALKELRQVEAEAGEQADSDATIETETTCEELASSLPEDVKDEPAPSPRPKRVETESPDRSSERDPSVRKARARERERLAMA